MNSITNKIKKLLAFQLFAIITLHYSQAAVYYVSTSGISSSPGTANSPWNLTYAVSTAIAGDTVYVKAGNYGYLQLNFLNSGDTLKPICFIGYQNQPGDLDSSSIPRTVAAYKSKDFSTIYPTLSGNTRDSGIAIFMYNRSHIYIANFYLTKYTEGVETYGSLCKNLKFENLLVTELGSIATYSGSAISIIYNSSSSVKHCFVYNSAAQGISLIQSNHCTIYDCTVLCDENTQYAATDYYFIIAGGDTNFVTEYNTIDLCYAERIGNLDHPGHGFVISVNYDTYTKAFSQYNTIKNCISNNISEAVHARGGGVRYNLFYNCKSISKGCIYASEGSHHNTFEKIELNNTDYGALSSYRSDINSYYIDQPWGTRANIFKNCIFNKTLEGFSFDDWPTNTSKGLVDSNVFYHCNFISADSSNSYFGRSEVYNNGNKFINCIIYGFKKYIWAPGTILQHTNFEFQNCLFWNNGYSSDSMDSAVSISCKKGDPFFVNSQNHDFHLNQNSAAIDAGTDSKISDDFDGGPRPCNKVYDIGVYEFQNCNTSISEEKLSPQFSAVYFYPNPTSNIINFYNSSEIKFVEIYDFCGRYIKSSFLPEQQMAIDFKEGLYNIKIYFKNHSVKSAMLIIAH